MHLYASLSHLGISNLRVARDRKKIKEGIPLPPILRSEMKETAG